MIKRGVFLNKKAQGEIETEFYSILIQIAILVMVSVALMMYLKSVRENTLFEKMYLTRDVALLINTMYAAPENIGYVYAAGKTNLSKYTFNGKDNYVEVAEKKGAMNQEKYYSYATDLHFAEEFQLITDSKVLSFMKNDNLFKVGVKGTGNLNMLICPNIKTSNISWRSKVIIDPGHGYDTNNIREVADIGYSSGTFVESVFTTNVADVLRSLGFALTRPFNTNLEIQLRLAAVANSDAVISLHVGNSSPDKNVIVAYISAESLRKNESRKLACLILNTFITQISVENIAIVPVFVSELPEQDPMKILLPEKVAVLLELGNINNKASIESLKPFDIANAINNALQVYYESR